MIKWYELSRTARKKIAREMHMQFGLVAFAKKRGNGHEVQIVDTLNGDKPDDGFSPVESLDDHEYLYELL